MFHTVLIGQLGKYIDPEYTSKLSLEEILDIAFSIIRKADETIAFNNVLLECDVSRNKLQQLYETYGFKELQRDDKFVEYLKTLKS